MDYGDGLWMDDGDGLWMDYGWIMDGLWMDYGWIMDGLADRIAVVIFVSPSCCRLCFV
jgi:hypothetical protein